MTRPELVRLLEETLGLHPHTLAGNEKLGDVEAWDSMSTLVFIAMVDRKFGLPLMGNQVVRCRTVEELIGLIGAAPLLA